MKILVYVEGPSDRGGLEAILGPVIEAGRSRGVGISFHPQGGKTKILEEVPRKAADHLSDRPGDLVIALPDLYPMAPYAGGPNAHESFEELEVLLRGRFEARASKLALPDGVRSRFRVHCLKHDLEVLLLAAPDSLRLRLRTSDVMKKAWRVPVEDQNDERPPKRVVEKLFDKYRRKGQYVDTVDAPWILERADLAAVQRACPQRFAPFVATLREAVGT